MNALLKAAAESIEMGWVLGFMTAVFLVVFLGWTWWAYSPKNRTKMDDYAKLPFDGIHEDIDGDVS